MTPVPISMLGDHVLVLADRTHTFASRSIEEIRQSKRSNFSGATTERARPSAGGRIVESMLAADPARRPRQRSNSCQASIVVIFGFSPQRVGRERSRAPEQAHQAELIRPVFATPFLGSVAQGSWFQAL